jgi:hypothetical protein
VENDDVVVDSSLVTPEAITPGRAEAPAAISAAQARFQACRWRRPAENGTPECCNHRDVLPMTGANGFDPGAWCPDCELYKLRRTPKKRDDWDVRY